MISNYWLIVFGSRPHSIYICILLLFYLYLNLYLYLYLYLYLAREQQSTNRPEKAREGRECNLFRLISRLQAPDQMIGERKIDDQRKSSLRQIYEEVRTHPPQFAQWELPQPVAPEGEGEDPGVLEGGREVRHGHVRTLDGSQVVTCTTWLQIPAANISCKYDLQI